MADSEQNLKALLLFVKLLQDQKPTQTPGGPTQGTTAAEAFLARVQRHVAHPITLVQGLPVLLRIALPGEKDLVRAAEDSRFGRAFSPALSNYLMSCLETFLEDHFVEQYSRGDATKYSSSEQWQADSAAFGRQHAAALGFTANAARQWVRRFSFQRLSDVEELYRAALGIDIAAAPSHPSVAILWKKRHLFTHRAGIIDRRFLDAYNTFHQGDTAKQLPPSAIGEQAYIELSWVVDALREVRAFVRYVVQHTNRDDAA